MDTTASAQSQANCDRQITGDIPQGLLIQVDQMPPVFHTRRRNKA